MKRILISILSLLLLALSGCGGGPDQGNIPRLSHEAHGRHQLDNGLIVHTLPTGDQYGELISLTVRIPGGQVYESEGQAGYSSVLTRLLAAAATDTGPGVQVLVENQEEAVYLSVDFLKQDALSALEQLEACLNLKATEESLEPVRQQLIRALEANRQSLAARINDQVNSSLFEGTPLAYTTAQRREAIESATVESVNNYIGQSVHPAVCSVAITGDLDEALLNTAAASLAAWSSDLEAIDTESFPAVTAKSAEFNIIDAAGDIAAFYILRNIPNPSPEDFYPLQAVNYIFNGANLDFRLDQINRSLEGGSGVESMISLRTSYSSNVIFGRVPAAQAIEAVSAARTQLEILLFGAIDDQRILEQELLDARNYLANNLLRRTFEPRRRNQFILWAESFGFTQVLPEEHVAMIKGITDEALSAAIDTYHQRETIVNALVVAGPEAELQSQFAQW